MNYTPLSQSERQQIYALLVASLPLSDIAEILHHFKSPIYCETSRNSRPMGYNPRQAKEKTHEIAPGSHNGPRITDAIC